MNVRTYMTAPLIKPHECSFDKARRSSLQYKTRITAPLVK